MSISVAIEVTRGDRTGVSAGGRFLHQLSTLPSPIKIEMVLSFRLATARSAPSPLKSAMAI
jgi:hypothetical protein